MSRNNTFQYKIICIPLFFIMLIWLCFWLQFRNFINWFELGVFPREYFGLYGILISPFIHSNLEHLINNTTSLFFLTMGVLYFFPKSFSKIVFFSIILSGLGTWLIGRSSYHIGASGLVYALVSFLFFKGILVRNYKLLAVSFLVIFQYGGIIWFMFPGVEDNISWEGHLSGFISGIFLSFFIDTPKEYKQIKYDWEHPDFNPHLDPFMKHFDKYGNFKPNPNQNTTHYQSFKIVYVIVKNDEITNEEKKYDLN